MNEAVTIRAARLDDLPRIIPLEAILFHLHCVHRPDLFEASYQYSGQELEELLGDPNCIALVAEQEERLVGLCFGRVSEGRQNPVVKPIPAAELEDLVVDPAFRGQGIATALLREAKKQAKILGAQYLRLRVWHFNEGAVALYRSLGFAEQWSMMEQAL